MNKISSLGAYISLISFVLLILYICYLNLSTKSNNILIDSSIESYIIWIVSGIVIFGMALGFIGLMIEDDSNKNNKKDDKRKN
ncbi:MAG: hypothetical protein J1F35_06550 [Erysipelotrichales bacterium]|nr:hypothetical protein [Erysipelotrichales bacterium]